MVPVPVIGSMCVCVCVRARVRVGVWGGVGEALLLFAELIEITLCLPHQLHITEHAVLLLVVTFHDGDHRLGTTG